MSVNMLSARLRSDAQPRAKNGQPAPQHDWRAENELHPSRPIAARPSRMRKKMPHRERKHRQAQRRANPETARHVGQLGVLFFSAGNRRSLPRAPYRKSDTLPDDPARSPDASDRCRLFWRRCGASDCVPTPFRTSDNSRACHWSTPSHIGQKYSFADAGAGFSISAFKISSPRREKRDAGQFKPAHFIVPCPACVSCSIPCRDGRSRKKN